MGQPAGLSCRAEFLLLLPECFGGSKLEISNAFVDIEAGFAGWALILFLLPVMGFGPFPVHVAKSG